MPAEARLRERASFRWRGPREGAGRQGTDVPVAALKDPQGANLDRNPDREGVGRRSGQGAGEDLRRRVVRNRKPARTASCRRRRPRWTSATALPTNTIGASELAAVWKDPDFKPDQRAFLLRAGDRDPGRRAGRPTTRCASHQA